MQIVITAGNRQWEEITNGNGHIDWIRVDNASGFSDYPQADAYFNLHDDAAHAEYPITGQPVFINSVITTLAEMNAAAPVIRINGWAGFPGRAVWDVAGQTNEKAEQVLAALGKKAVAAPDQPGLIAARVIAMIINEAFYAVGDGVSSREETDIAMKLGTNYPFGPFEWCSTIGTNNVAALLLKLSGIDHRYTPAPLLIKESQSA